MIMVLSKSSSYKQKQFVGHGLSQNFPAVLCLLLFENHNLQKGNHKLCLFWCVFKSSCGSILFLSADDVSVHDMCQSMSTCNDILTF